MTAICAVLGIARRSTYYTRERVPAADITARRTTSSCSRFAR
jgi:hypothetical protein